jgi:hypothetical protein
LLAAATVAARRSSGLGPSCGFGRPLFDDYDVPIDLDLLEQRSFKGATMHRYESEVTPC